MTRRCPRSCRVRHLPARDPVFDACDRLHAAVAGAARPARPSRTCDEDRGGTIALFVGGMAMMIAGHRAMARHGTNVNPLRPTTALVTDGVFRYTRNPLYVGVSIALCGIALVVALDWVLVLIIPAFVLLHFAVVMREERYLERKFGEAYHRYAARAALPVDEDRHDQLAVSHQRLLAPDRRGSRASAVSRRDHADQPSVGHPPPVSAVPDLAGLRHGEHRRFRAPGLPGARRPYRFNRSSSRGSCPWAPVARSIDTQTELRRARRSSCCVGVAAGPKRVPLLPLHRREPCAAHRLPLHEIDEQHIGSVEVVMAGRRAGRFRLAAQLFVHAQPLGEDRSPHASVSSSTASISKPAPRNSSVCCSMPIRRRGRHAVPQQLPLRVRQGPMHDPVGEGDASAGAQHAMRLGKGARDVGHMQQRFLADDGVVARIRQRQVHHIAFEHAHLAVETDAPRSAPLRPRRAPASIRCR